MNVRTWGEIREWEFLEDCVELVAYHEAQARAGRELLAMVAQPPEGVRVEFGERGVVRFVRPVAGGGRGDNQP